MNAAWLVEGSEHSDETIERGQPAPDGGVDGKEDTSSDSTRDEKEPEEEQRAQQANENELRVYGLPAEEELAKQEQQYRELVHYQGQERALRDWEYDRGSQSYRRKQHRARRVYRNPTSHFIRRFGVGVQREELVYVKEPDRREQNFMRLDPRLRFEQNFRLTDPISSGSQHQWGRMGDYVSVVAKPLAIHMRIKRKLSERAMKLLLTRILEHAKEKTAKNPRLVSVHSKGRKKLVKAVFNTQQLLGMRYSALMKKFKKVLKSSKHLILRQDSVGGKLHERVANDDLL